MLSAEVFTSIMSFILLEAPCGMGVIIRFTDEKTEALKI